MNRQRLVKYGHLIVVLGVLFSLLTPADFALATINREEPLPGGQVIQGSTKLAGAYFFYWWLLPNDPDGVNPATQMAFHPPGVATEDTCFHNPPYCIPYQGGPYNNAYYNVNEQRWWEWQFRDMAEAGLDIVFMSSWDGVSLCDPGNPDSGFMTRNKTIRVVKDYLIPALDTIGNPLRIALYDDTWSEHHQWCLDNGFPLPNCDDDLFHYPMSLIGSTCGRPNREYFWYKWQQFYDAIPRRMWATHNGLPVEQGGRPLILMWHGWFFYDLGYASETMCSLKEAFYNRYGVEPFLLPDADWQEPPPSDLRLDIRCPSPHSDWYAIDGWSSFGKASSGEGAQVFSNSNNGYTTAYLGVGADTCVYSGPYGGITSTTDCQTTGYYARWWDIGTGVDPWFNEGEERQDFYFFRSWDAVNNQVNLVVIESWNELKEGTSISRLETYIAPDLTWCVDHGWNGCFHGGCERHPDPCPEYKVFTADPQEGWPWVARYWMVVTHDAIAGWKAAPTPQVLTVDNNNDESQCPDQGSFSGDWPIYSTPLWPYCVDTRYTTRGTGGTVQWMPRFPSPGVYDLYAWWPKDAGGSQDARLRVFGQTEALVRVDQSRGQDAGYWNYVGSFPFAPGSGVEMPSNADTGEVILADAIRLVYRGAYTPRPLSFHTYFPIVFRHQAGAAGSTPLPTPSIPSYPPAAIPTQTPPPPPPPSTPPPYPPPPTSTPLPSPTPTPTPGDHEPPSSSVDPLPHYSNRPVGFPVTWSGTDPGGSGICLYDIQYKDGVWNDWLPHTSLHGGWFTPVEHGHTYYFRSRATDRAGNVEPWPQNPDYDTFTTVDLLPPTSQVNALPAYSQASFTVSWGGEDPTSGIASYDVQVCRDNCTEPRQAVWNDWLLQTTATSALYNDGQEGPVYFRCRARDRAGNVETYPPLPDAQTTIDRTAPTSQVGPLPLYSSATFTVSWSGEDNLSGIASYDIQVCQDNCADPTWGWTTWLTKVTQTASLFTSGEHGHTYYFRSRARDHAGNVEEWPASPDASTLVDTLPPSSQVSALPPYSTATFTVSWSGEDGASGVASYDVQFCAGQCNEPTGGGGAWQDWLTRTTRTSAAFTGGEHGQTYHFRCRARDRAGNIEPWPANPDASTIVDARPPESQVQGLPLYTTAAFTVTWSGEDSLSGIASYDVQYCVGDCTDPLIVWTDWLQRTPYTSSLFTGGEDGRTYNFRSRAHDHAGNVEEWPASPDAFTLVDALPPTSTVQPLPAYSLPDFLVSWEGWDTVSGIASYDIQVCTDTCSLETSWHDWLTYTAALSATFTGGEDGQTYYFRSRARDYVGHLEKWPPEPSASTTVDAAPPTSQVEPLPEYSPAVFTVTWAGQDAGCGLASYDVQVCTCPDPGDECCQDWLTGITNTAAIFTGTHGQTYYFRSRARDFLGNLEDYPAEADAFTLVDAVPPTTWFEGYSSYSGVPTFLVRWNGVDKLSSLVAYSLYFRDESLPAWQPWLEGVTVTQALFTGEVGHTYYLCIRGQDRAGNIEDKGCPGPAEGWPIEGELVLVAPPASRVEPLPPYAPGTSFTVRWSSTPPKTLYQVQVMDLEEGQWQDWLETPEHSAFFQGRPGHAYAFRCRAQDPGSGVWEAWPWGEDTRTQLPPAEPQDRPSPSGAEPARSSTTARFAHGTLPKPI